MIRLKGCPKKLSICLPIYIYLSIYLSINLSIYQSINLSIYQSILIKVLWVQMYQISEYV